MAKIKEKEIPGFTIHLKNFYHDYDCLNKKLIKHYKIKEIHQKGNPNI